MFTHLALRRGSAWACALTAGKRKRTAHVPHQSHLGLPDVDLSGPAESPRMTNSTFLTADCFLFRWYDNVTAFFVPVRQTLVRRPGVQGRVCPPALADVIIGNSFPMTVGIRGREICCPESSFRSLGQCEDEAFLSLRCTLKEVDFPPQTKYSRVADDGVSDGHFFHGLSVITYFSTHGCVIRLISSSSSVRRFFCTCVCVCVCVRVCVHGCVRVGAGLQILFTQSWCAWACTTGECVRMSKRSASFYEYPLHLGRSQYFGQ